MHLKIIFFFITLNYLIAEQEIYQHVKINLHNTDQLQELYELGIPLDHYQRNKDNTLDIVLSTSEKNILVQNGINFQVIQDDLTNYYLNRSQPNVDRDFPLGSMLGNYTLLEAMNQMDTLSMLYPSFVSEKDSIGTSFEGRTIWAFKLSDNPSIDEDEPEVLFTGLTHAREPLSMMNLFYFANWICENYNSDITANYLLDNREMWFIPIINPDGYAYNESISPDGGGMHRKNRRSNPPNSSCNMGTQQGVDLNRNYGYNWGVNNSGSSGNPCSAVYRGSSAFSEPETEAISNFILSREFSNVLHYHSYSNFLIHSWGDGSFPDEPDLTTLREIGKEMTRYNGYLVGTGTETVGYGVNGDAVDWSYGTAGLISYTPEVGSFSDNFWPSEDRVIPLCQDQVYSNSIFALVAGSDYIIYDRIFNNSYPEIDDTISISLVIQNRGLNNSNGSVTLGITPLNSFSSLSVDNITIATLPARSSDTTDILLSVSSEIENGTKGGLIISLHDSSSFNRLDTVSIIFGDHEEIFYDGAENGMIEWSEDDNWGTIFDASEGLSSITDSPVGNYIGDWGTSKTQLSRIINFSGIFYPFITFDAKWDIEQSYDFVQFQASTDGVNWTPLSGNYTSIGSGSGVQTTGEPMYDGLQEDWINETIDLSFYTNKPQVWFRFTLKSDGAVEEDGFYFDNFYIHGYSRFIKGDINQDNSINIYDLIMLIEFIILGNTLPDQIFPLADINFDNIINSDDIVSLIYLIMNSY
ncbi:MAG: M14 family zinc carboxypeptidase [Candidatus Neomarinimicrobiota bacterium]|nr:M14 family zinc carboxypeptidase [Candidatus Neomarinimicrobiota bacterium]